MTKKADNAKHKLGRPPKFKNKMTMVKITLNVPEDVPRILLEKYGCTTLGEAYTRALSHVAKVKLVENTVVDSNVTRRARKEEQLEVEKDVADK